MFLPWLPPCERWRSGEIQRRVRCRFKMREEKGGPVAAFLFLCARVWFLRRSVHLRHCFSGGIGILFLSNTRSTAGMKQVLWGMILCGIASCGVVRSPRDGYGMVRKCDRACLAKYTPDAPLYPGNSTQYMLYEITGVSVRAFMGNPDVKTCVVIWRPWAKGVGCHDLRYYDSLSKEVHAAGATFWLVSPYYDVPGVRKRKSCYGYAGRLFVMDHDAYGKRPRRRAQRRFVEELLAREDVGDSVTGAASYLFSGDSLMYAGGVEGMVTRVRR